MAPGREKIRLRDIREGKVERKAETKGDGRGDKYMDEEIAFITLENPKEENPRAKYRRRRT